MFELICNVLLVAGLAYSYAFHVLEADIPRKVLRNPFALNPDIWPKTIIVIIIVLLLINIIRILRKNKGNPDFSFGTFFSNCGKFLASRQFVGIMMVVIACFILEPLGYMVTCALMLFCYGLLLGERKIVRLVIMTVFITMLLYVVFSVLLSVNLPRGTVPELRNFALQVEAFVTSLKGSI